MLDHIDLHDAVPAATNSRVTDIGSGKTRESRLGVYLHWTIPQFYRMGSSSAGGSKDPTQNTSAAQAERKRRQGFPSSDAQAPRNGAKADTTSPSFRPLPNRWLVTRRLDKSSIGIAGVDYPKGVDIPDFDSWVVQSDALESLDEIGQKYGLDFDVQVERSPFLSAAQMDPANDAIIDSQAEVFIGKKTRAADWNRDAADAEPHVDLTVMASANPLFVDYCQHNMNVFTIVDNFRYTSIIAGKTSTVYLKKAKADYSILGWHSSADNDPFTTYATSADLSDPTVPKNADRLSDCRMRMKTVSDPVQNWLNSSSASRVLLHASKYGVTFNRTADQPANTVLASSAGNTIRHKQPIAIGATPIDALLAFCQAHKDAADDKMHDVYQMLLRIQSLLHETEDDDVAGLQAAADENYEQSFQKFESGVEWHFKLQTDPNSPPAEATNLEKLDLLALNQMQAVVDNLSRECSKKQWYLFAAWWNYVSGFIENTKGPRYRENISKWLARLKQLNDWIPKWTAQIEALKTKLSSPSKGTPDRFFQKKDPTILFGNVSRGWDEDFVEKVCVRLRLPVAANGQTVTANPSKYRSSLNGWEASTDHFKMVSGKAPKELQASIAALLDEFRELNSNNAVNTSEVDLPRVIPWYHNEAQRNDETGLHPYDETRSRDLWQSTQPWRPLFVEWEAHYYHIAFEKWDMIESERLSNWGAKVVHYSAVVDLTKPENHVKDIRRVAGRNYLTPQAASTLKTTLENVFNNTNARDLADPDKYDMPEATRAQLLNTIAGLETVSTPMTGLTSHILTLCEGTHLKPLVRLPNQTALPIATARDAILPALKDPRNNNQPIIDPDFLLRQMDTETTLTPYGDIAVNVDQPPMKPVTHGQLMFTKLNVIDKFGQVISAIDPGIRQAGVYPTITPCISDSFFPGTVGGADPKLPNTRANVVIPQVTNDACPFISLPPSINQPSRLNASFVVKDIVKQNWRQASDWDLDPGPVIGWLLVNYANQGLQIFFPDGTFYREVRLGGRHKTSAGFKFLPFEPPNDATASGAVTELDEIIKLLTTQNDSTYLQGFFDMINQSVGDNQSHAPQSYATYSSAIVGKPLAIVNAGWSLQLASEESQSWSTFYEDYVDKASVKPSPSRTLLNQGAQRPRDDPLGYTFPVKFGDKERSFDGLVGYFLPRTPEKRMSTEIDYTTLYTYFTDTLDADAKKRGNDPRVPIATSNFPRFTPFWLPPSDPAQPAPSLDPYLQVLTLIMDPFLPVHAYSAILPNKSLTLPPYTVERALKRISAFFQTGPLLSSLDVQSYNEAMRLTGSYVDSLRPALPNTLATAVQAADPLPSVHLPLSNPVASQGSSGAQYRYLQPYFVANKDWTEGSTTQTKMRTSFNAFAIDGNAAAGSEALEAKLAPGPYTALEGYLQVVKSVVEDQNPPQPQPQPGPGPGPITSARA